MGYNKKILSKAVSELGKAKAPAKPKDIITDPKGQWAHPGQVTRIPGNNITMQGVPYPVYGVDNTGFAQMMYPGQDYQFQGDYVDEYPLTQAKKGGEKKYSRSLSATNKLFKKNPLVKAKKKKNKKTFDPNAKYYQDGGENWTEQEALEDYRNMFQNMVEVDYETSNSSKSFEYMPNGNVKEVTKYYDVPKIDKLPTKPIKSIDTNISSIDNKPLNNFTFINRYNPKTNSWIQNTVPANSLSDKLNQEREEWKRKNIQQQEGGYVDLDLDDDEILELQKGGYIVEYLDDPSIPELTQAQTGGQKDAWGRSLNDKWYGFDPKTKKYTIAPYKIQELRKQAAGVSKYDPLYQKAIPSETTQQAAKNLPSQKKSVNEAMAIKTAEKDATIKAVKELPLLTEEQKNEILMDPRKLDEYSYLTRLAQQPDTVKESIPYSARERAWDIVTNPFDAFEYAVRTGDVSNMPRNYNQMKMAGIDPSAGGGANAVGNLLNTFNPLDAGDKVVRNIGEGNYGTAALEAMRFIPSSGIVKPALGRAGRLGNKAVDYVGSTNVVYNPVTKFAGLTPSATTASNFINKYGTVDKLLKAGTIAKTTSYVPQASEDIYGIGKNIYNMYGADSKKQNLLQQDIGNRVSNLGNMAYDTFLDYTKLNYTKPFKATKYLEKSNENPDDVVSDYKAVKYLSPLLKRQSGGLIKAQEGIQTSCPEGYSWDGTKCTLTAPDVQDLQEVQIYNNPEKRKLQGDLLDKLQQVKGAYQDWRQDAGLRKASLKSEGASSIEALRAQINEYKKELEEEKKKYSRAQTALNILKKKRPDEWKNAKLSDVMSSKGIESLRSLYSEGTLTEGAFRDFYNNFGSQYDTNVKKGTGPDKDYSAKETEQEWMENVPEFVEKVGNFAAGAALLPAAAVIAPAVISGTSAVSPYLTAAARSPLGRWLSTAASRAFLADTLVNEVPETLRSVDQAIAGEKSWADAGQDVAWTAADLLFSKGAAKDILKRGKKLFEPIAKTLDTPIGEAFIRSNAIFKKTPSGRFAQAAAEGIKNLSTTDALKIIGVSGGLSQVPRLINEGVDLSEQLNNQDLSRRDKWDAAKNYSGNVIRTASLVSPLSPKVLKPLIDYKPVQYGLLQDNINRIIQGDVIPPGQVIRNYRNITGLTPTSGFRLRQTGGELNSYTATLSKKEIRELEKQGYNIEYLD
jgi:hypothetical protein